MSEMGGRDRHDGDTGTSEREWFTFRVEGSEESQTALPTRPRPFDETYRIAGEHPAEALEKLLHEIEWGVLDSYSGFTIELLPEGDDRG